MATYVLFTVHTDNDDDTDDADNDDDNDTLIFYIIDESCFVARISNAVFCPRIYRFG